MLHVCDQCDKSFAQKSQLTLHKIAHKYNQTECDNHGKAFVTTKELRKHSCVILNQDVKLTMTQSSIGSYLDNADVMKTKSMWNENAHINSDNIIPPNRQLSKSFDSLDTIEFSAEVPQRQIIPRKPNFWHRLK